MSHKDISAYQKLLFNRNPNKMAEVISLEKVVELVKKLSLPDQIHQIEKDRISRLIDRVDGD